MIKIYKYKTFNELNTALKIFYKKRLEVLNGRSSRILLFISGRKQADNIKNSVEGLYEEIEAYTYKWFVRKEIELYFPLYDKMNTDNTPLSVEDCVSEYVLYKDIENKRRESLYFDDITSSSENIAKSICNNMKSAAEFCTDIFSTGEKIYYTKKNMDRIERKSFSESDAMISNMIEKFNKSCCMNEAMYLWKYTEELLNNDKYIESVSERFDTVIVDSMEKMSISEALLLKKLRERGKDIHIFSLINGELSSFESIDIDEINNIFSIDENKSDNHEDIQEYYYKIKEIIDVQTIPDMIDELLYIIKSLEKGGLNKNDIAIILPPGSYISSIDIIKKLEKENIKSESLISDNMLSDNITAQTLITSLMIFDNEGEGSHIIEDMKYIRFIQEIFDVNSLKAAEMYKSYIKEKYNEKKSMDAESVNSLIEYIRTNKSIDTLSDFARKFSEEKIINNKHKSDDSHEMYIEKIRVCRRIVSELEKLEKLCEKDVINREDIFKILEYRIKDYIPGYKTDEIINGDDIVIMTPGMYINAGDIRKTVMIMDISNSMWSPKIDKEISNREVLKKSYSEKRVFTDSDEDILRKKYSKNLLLSIMKQADRIYTFRSEYSINGFIQDSMINTEINKVEEI